MVLAQSNNIMPMTFSSCSWQGYEVKPKFKFAQTTLYCLEIATYIMETLRKQAHFKGPIYLNGALIKATPG